MKVYQLDWPKREGPKVDAALDIYLPKVRCERCGRVWGDGDFMYPALDFEFFCEPAFDLKNVVDRKTFGTLSKRIQAAYGRDILLIPGCSVGPLTGTAITTKLSDFEWGNAICPMISKRAEILLRERGLQLATGKCKITVRGKFLSSHLAIQPEPALLVPDVSLKENATDFCRVCNYYSRDPLIKKPRYYQFQKSNWPPGQPLVSAIETGYILATEQFIAAVASLKLTGLTFVECGVFL